MKQQVIFCVTFLIIFCNICNGSDFDDVTCDKQLELFSDSLLKHERWALELFDSWSKVQSGIFNGNTIDLGNYDQCLAFSHKPSTQNIDEIEPQYCLITYRPIQNRSSNENTNLSFDWTNIGEVMRENRIQLTGSVCMPSKCSYQKILKFVNEILKNADLEMRSDREANACTTFEELKFEIIDWIFIVVFGILIILLLSSTSYELYMIKNNEKPNELYSSFSIYKNGQTLFNIEKAGKSSFLTFISGLRTFAMFHLLLGHRFEWVRPAPTINAKYVAQGGGFLTSLTGAFVSVHPIAVDTFFVIGGFLLTRSMLSQIDKRKLNIPKLYLHRYLRITPVFAFLILFIMSVMKFFGNGPLWKSTINGGFIKSCENNWWAAILHFQNYKAGLESCLLSSWYLAVDFQLVLISPLLMYPIHRFGWKFLWTLPVYITGTQIWLFITTLENEFKAFNFLMPPDAFVKFADTIYFPTHVRCTSWLLGVILGYIMFKNRGSHIAINRKLNLMIWTIAIAVLITILFGMKPLHSLVNSYNIGNAFWISCHRTSWALAIAWILFSCQQGSGGVFKWFMELSIWQPLGKISLSFYLVQTIILTIIVRSQKTVFHFSEFSLFESFASDTVISIFCAIFLYLAIEQPSLVIENYIYKRREMKKVVLSD